MGRGTEEDEALDVASVVGWAARLRLGTGCSGEGSGKEKTPWRVTRSQGRKGGSGATGLELLQHNWMQLDTFSFSSNFLNMIQGEKGDARGEKRSTDTGGDAHGRRPAGTVRAAVVRGCRPPEEAALYGSREIHFRPGDPAARLRAVRGWPTPVRSGQVKGRDLRRTPRGGPWFLRREGQRGGGRTFIVGESNRPPSMYPRPRPGGESPRMSPPPPRGHCQESRPVRSSSTVSHAL